MNTLMLRRLRNWFDFENIPHRWLIIAVFLAIGFFGTLIAAGLARGATVHCPTNGPCYGTSGPDLIYPKVGTTTVNAYQGNDTVYGSLASTVIDGGDGADTVFGGGGNDSLWGGPGGDWLYGEEGNDNIIGQGGNDYVSGGNQPDTVNVAHCDLDDKGTHGGAGTDSIYYDQGSGDFYSLTGFENYAPTNCS